MAATHEKSETVTSGSKIAVAAAVVGNVLEWYDYAVFGFLAGLIGRHFFPAGDETSQLLSAFAVFGVGFLMRPLGGIVIGRIGDVKGRKTALLITMLMMAFGTVLIGVVPTYSTIGIAAPVIVVFARLAQGFSAGGEWGSSTSFIVEWAPEGKRGFYGSFQQCSIMVGLLLGSGTTALVTTILAPGAMESWGWRIPFLLGGVLGPWGLYMRRNIQESPAYTKAMKAPAVADSRQEATPIRLGARVFGFTVLWTVAFYIFFSYMPTFTTHYLKLGKSEALWSNTVGLLAAVIAIPLMGLLSDRIGRKPPLLASGFALILLPYPVFSWLLSGASFGTIILMQVGFAVIIASFSGPGPAAIAEIFPTRTRSTWMSTGYALSVAIFGGFAPYVATWLIKVTGKPISPFYYVIAAAVSTTIVIAGLKETAHKPLG